jgi:hypothetical protein
MVRYILLAFAFSIFSGLATAADGSKHISSGDFKLQRSAPYESGIESATWLGPVLVQGKLYLDIDRNPEMPDVAGKAESFLSFVPDGRSMDVLPRISGSVYPARPTLINLRNASLSNLGLENILSAGEVARIKKESFGHYEWPSALVIKSLTTDLGCDSRYFYSLDYQLKMHAEHGEHLDRPKHLGC